MKIQLPRLGAEIQIADQLAEVRIGDGRRLIDGRFRPLELTIEKTQLTFTDSHREPIPAQILVGDDGIVDGAIPVLLGSRFTKAIGIWELVGRTEVTGWLQEDGLRLPMIAAHVVPEAPTDPIWAVLRRVGGIWEIRPTPAPVEGFASFGALLVAWAGRQNVTLRFDTLAFDWQALAAQRTWAATMTGSCRTREGLDLHPSRVSGSNEGLTFVEGDFDEQAPRLVLRGPELTWPADGLPLALVPFATDRRIPVPTDAAAWFRTTQGWLRVEPDRRVAWAREAGQESREVQLGARVGKAVVRLLLDQSGGQRFSMTLGGTVAKTEVAHPAVAVESDQSVRWSSASRAALPPEDPVEAEAPAPLGEGGALFTSLIATSPGAHTTATLVAVDDGLAVRLDRAGIHWRPPVGELLYTPSSWAEDPSAPFRTTAGLVPVRVEVDLTAQAGRWEVHERTVAPGLPPDGERCYGVGEGRLGLEWDPGTGRAWWRRAVALLDLRWRGSTLRTGTVVPTAATAVKGGIRVGHTILAVDALSGFPDPSPVPEAASAVADSVPGPRVLTLTILGAEVARVALESETHLGMVRAVDGGPLVLGGLDFDAVAIQESAGTLTIGLQSPAVAGTLVLSGVLRGDVLVVDPDVGGTLRADAAVFHIPSAATVTHVDLSRVSIRPSDAGPTLHFGRVAVVCGTVAGRYVRELPGCAVVAAGAELVVVGGSGNARNVTWTYEEGALAVVLRHTVAGLVIVEALTSGRDSFTFTVGSANPTWRPLYSGARLLLVGAGRVEATYAPVGPLLQVRALTRICLELCRDPEGDLQPRSGMMGWEIERLGDLRAVPGAPAHATLRFQGGVPKIQVDGPLRQGPLEVLFWRQVLCATLDLSTVSTTVWVSVPVGKFPGLSEHEGVRVVPALALTIDAGTTTLSGTFGIAREALGADPLAVRPPAWTSRRWLLEVETTDTLPGRAEIVVAMNGWPPQVKHTFGLGEGTPLGRGCALGKLEAPAPPLPVSTPGGTVAGVLPAIQMDERARALTLTASGWSASPVLGWRPGAPSGAAAVRLWIVGPAGFTLLAERPDPAASGSHLGWAAGVLADVGWLREAVVEIPIANPGDVEWLPVDSPLLNPTIRVDTLPTLPTLTPLPPLPTPAPRLPTGALALRVAADQVESVLHLDVSGPSHPVAHALELRQGVEFAQDRRLASPPRWAPPKTMGSDDTSSRPFGPARLRLSARSPRPGEQVTQTVRASAIGDGPRPWLLLSALQRATYLTNTIAPGAERPAAPVVTYAPPGDHGWRRVSVAWTLAFARAWTLRAAGVTLLRAGPEAVSVRPDVAFPVAVAASRTALDALRTGGGALVLVVALDGPGTLTASTGQTATKSPLRVPLDLGAVGDDQAWHRIVGVTVSAVAGDVTVSLRVVQIGADGSDADVDTRGQQTPLPVVDRPLRPAWTHVAVLDAHAGGQRIAAWGLDSRRGWSPHVTQNEAAWVRTGEVQLREYGAGHAYAVMTITPDGSRTVGPFTAGSG